MTNSVGTSAIQHLGWCRATFDEQQKRIRTEKEIDQLIQQKLFSPSIKSDVDWSTREVVVLTLSTRTLQENVGVKNIRGNQVNLVYFTPPGTVGQMSIGSQSILLTVPKEAMGSLSIKTSELILTHSDGYREAEIRYKEVFNPRLNGLDHHVRKNGLTEESMLKQGWFQNLSAEHQFHALVRLKAHMEFTQFKTEYYNHDFAQKAESLKGKSYNPEQ